MKKILLEIACNILSDTRQSKKLIRTYPYKKMVSVSDNKDNAP